MIELYPGFFAMLRLSKRLHDSGLMHKIPDEFQTLALDEDFYYELAYTAIDAVFETTIRDCNEDRGMDIYVFCDPLIDRFCQLCRQYELSCRMTEEENPYRKDIERIIRTGFCLGGYDYDFIWKLSASDRGRPRILFFCGEEFCSLEELPECLLEIREGFQTLNFQMEKVLSSQTEETVKEAA